MSRTFSGAEAGPDSAAEELQDRLGRARQAGGVVSAGTDKQLPKPRQRYPYDKQRHKRVVSVTLPSVTDKERLVQAAENFNQHMGLESKEQLSTSGMAALLVLAALEQYERGELTVVPQTKELTRWRLQRG
ncbi:MAG: hypothetical protein JXM73_13925 [Anaerolineae bacterium]|nr:hypothetical protein [Anaerolineae bacterium]